MRRPGGGHRFRAYAQAAGGPDGGGPVSYTHLTLPTSDLSEDLGGRRIITKKKKDKKDRLPSVDLDGEYLNQQNEGSSHM